MGGSTASKIQYSTPISEPKKGESAIYRDPKFADALLATPQDGHKTMQQLYTHNFKTHADTDFLGQRPRMIVPGEETKLEERFEFETWAQVEDMTKALGSGILNLNLVPYKAQFRDYNLRFVAIYGKNSREWVLTDIANSIYNITSIPIYDTLGEEATDYMFNQTELATCFLTCNHIEGIVARVKGGNVTHLKNLVIMDEWNLTASLKMAVQNCPGLNLYEFSAVVREGRNNL
jgi:long-chain acyl-CoA synthetase